MAMTPVSQVDRLVLLLRQRIQEKDRLAGGRRSAVSRRQTLGGVEAARALAAIEDIDERQLRRALIQGLLSDHFGSRALNQASFQQLVDRVLSALETDAAGNALLARLSVELRANAT